METLGKYGLLEKMGEGTLGAVHKAHDNVLNRFVALVTLGTDLTWDPARKEGFLEEYRALQRLRHRNIAAIFDQGEERKFLYLVTELVSGTDMARLIAEKSALTLERKLGIMLQITEGLGHAHAKGVHHQNLCPENIHLLHDGTIKITGFGFRSLHGLKGTEPGNPLAQTRYPSPEQLAGAEPSASSDMFSLGLILYEFLTGVHPFHDEDAGRTLENIRFRDSFPTVEQFPELPLNLWPILERCLAKSGEDRYASIRDLGAACQSVLEELAEDSEWMRVELQTALPKIRKAARRPSAPLSIARLLCDVERELPRGEELDYQTLNKLVVTLAEHRPLMEESAGSAVDTLQSGDELQVMGPAGTERDGVEPAARTPSMRAAAIVTQDPHISGKTPSPAAPKQKEIPGAASPFTESQRSPIEIRGTSIHAESLKTVQPSPNPPRAGAIAQDRPLRNPAADREEDMSELLRRIDQEQESTQKLVNSFLAGRQAGAATRGTESSEISPEPPGIQGSQSNGASQDGTPNKAPAPTLVPTDQLKEMVRQIRQVPDHPSPGADFADGAADAAAVIPNQGRRRVTLWISLSMLALILAFAVPWVRDQFSSVTGMRASGNRGAAQPVDPVTNALREQLNSARRDILLEEAQVLLSVGRRADGKIFLLRLLELYPGFAPAQKELDRIRAEEGSTGAPENPPGDPPPAPGAPVPAARGVNQQKIRSEPGKANQLAPGSAGQGLPGSQLHEPVQNTVRELPLNHDLSRLSPVAAVETLGAAKAPDSPSETRTNARQQAYRFAVEHPHGLLRGNCKGNLTVDSTHVVYEPESGSHGFSVPLKNLKIRVENRSVVLLFAVDNTEFFNFRLPDASAARRLQAAWNQLTFQD
jgi:serine/threonine protein kinase